MKKCTLVKYLINRYPIKYPEKLFQMINLVEISLFGDWLLCDFHIQTKMSASELSLDEIVDFYGEKGFDVLTITDHILDAQHLELYRNEHERVPAIEKTGFEDYL